MRVRLFRSQALAMVATPDYIDFLREQFAPLGPIETRRMFGKTGIFIDGAMLGMVADNTLYFRVDDDIDRRSPKRSPILR